MTEHERYNVLLDKIADQKRQMLTLCGVMFGLIVILTARKVTK